MESLILELPVPATEGQRHCCRVAGAFDEAEERLEPGNEIVHVVIRKSKPGRPRLRGETAREVRDGGVRLAARAPAFIAPGAVGDDHVDAVAVCALRRYQRRERRRRAPFTGRQLLTRTLVDDGHDRMFQTRRVGRRRRRDARPQVVPVVPRRGRRAARRHEIDHQRRHWLGDANDSAPAPLHSLHYARLPRNTRRPLRVSRCVQWMRRRRSTRRLLLVAIVIVGSRQPPHAVCVLVSYMPLAHPGTIFFQPPLTPQKTSDCNHEWLAPSEQVSRHPTHAAAAAVLVSAHTTAQTELKPI